MRISDWSSDVCSSDLRYPRVVGEARAIESAPERRELADGLGAAGAQIDAPGLPFLRLGARESAAGQQRDIGAASRVAHGAVAEDLERSRTRRIGQILTRPIVGRVAPECAQGCEGRRELGRPWCRETGCQYV